MPRQRFESVISSYTGKKIGRFARVAKAVGILSRVAKLIRVYALQQHTMREVNQLRDKFADGLTKKDSEMLHEQAKVLLQATHRQESLSDLIQKAEQDSVVPWVQYSSGKMEGVHFNPMYFNASRCAMLPNKLRLITKKSPHDRNSAEIGCLRSYLQKLHSFKQFSNDLQNALCKVMRYEMFERRRVIIRKGHIAHSMYFLCYGNVGVSFSDNEDVIFSTPDPITLRPGACFGEMALITKAPRNATICCIEACEFMVIDADDFARLGLGMLIEEELEKRVKFFKESQLMHQEGLNPDLDLVRKMARESKLEQSNAGTVIEADVCKSRFTTFIYQGSAEVYRIVDLTEHEEFEECLNEVPEGYQQKRFSPTENYSICSRVGRLITGDFLMSSEEECRKLTVISQGATLIRFETSRLIEYGLGEQLRFYNVVFMQDNKIVRQFMEENKWRWWKKKIYDMHLQKTPHINRMKFNDENLSGCAYFPANVASSNSAQSMESCCDIPLTVYSEDGEIVRGKKRKEKMMKRGVSRMKLEQKREMIDSVHLQMFNSDGFIYQSLKAFS